MAKKLMSIYEYFSEYSENEINYAILDLSDEEKMLLDDRYGYDLHNPISSNWNEEKTKRFYSVVIPKLRKKLEYYKEYPIVNLASLVAEGKTNIEICNTLNIDNNKLYEMLLELKNNGMMTSRKYYSDGTILYSKVRGVSEYRNERGQDRTLITDTRENDIKALVISDLHFGNKLERIDLADRCMNYCVKNGINVILCGGDLIDGTFTRGEQNIKDTYAQIRHFIKNYPYDKSVLTFSVAGDHDLSALNNDGLNIIEILNNYRHDVIVGGFNNMGINIKNDQIHLYHHVTSGMLRETTAPVILHGHNHQYKIELRDGKLNATIPSLSEICQPMPTALEFDFHFKNGYIESVNVRQIHFGVNDVVLNETAYQLPFNHKYEHIYNVELFKNYNSSKKEENNSEEESEETKLVLTPKTEHISQIDKFYKRWKK